MGGGNVFRLGIIGAGGIAGAHASAAKAAGGRISVVAVADPAEGSRVKMAEATGGKAFASPEALFAEVGKGLEVDGVVVCTPPSVRTGIVEAALSRGIAVLAEKPLAHTAADSRKLLDLSRKHAGARTAVAYCHRFTPAVREMRRLTAEGRIGTLERFENVFACDLPHNEGKWMSDLTASGGGAFIDMGCHSLDLYHFLVGPSAVAGSVYQHKWPGRTETAATVLVRSTGAGTRNVPPGVAGVILSGWSETARFAVSLVGTAGMLHYDYEKPTELVFKDLNGKIETLAVESHEVRFAKQLVAFADYAQGGDNPGLATFEEGLLAAEGVEAAARLAKG